jgi:choloylglycine hydrolase
MKNTRLLRGAATIIGCAVFCFVALPCTRLLYRGSESLYIVARSLDWKTPIPTNLYVYPRDVEKRSSNLPGAFHWQSRYGAVYAVSYDGGVTEGMNEEGLVVNGLFCRNTIYNDSAQPKNNVVSLAMFVPWLLDQCATVADVRRQLLTSSFEIQGATFDSGTVSALHWGATDSTGESIIFEFDRGTVNVYDMEEYLAMTNDPQWPEMTAILDYWIRICGTHMLPGTVSSPDRCVRANFFAHNVASVPDAHTGIAIARTLLYNSCVPYTYTVEGELNLSSTQWRSYADLRDLRYYFEIVTNPAVYYIDLTTLDLAPGAPILKLDTSKTSNVVGNANAHLHRSEAFTPMW